jgi:hypothetical protein
MDSHQKDTLAVRQLDTNAWFLYRDGREIDRDVRLGLALPGRRTPFGKRR